MSMKIIFSLLVMMWVLEGGPISWSQISSIRVGQLNPVVDIMTQADTSPSLTDHTFTYYSQMIGVTNTAHLQYGLSLISYESWVTDAFSFNISMRQYNTIGGIIRFVVQDTTFILKARTHYIIINRNPARDNCIGTNCDYNMQAIYGCYVTTTLLDPDTADNNREQLVGGLQTSSVATGHPDLSRLIIYSMLTGLNLKNGVGMNNYVKIDTFVNTTTKVFHKVTVQKNNLLIYFCATTIILDPVVSKQSYMNIIQYETKELNATNQGLKSVKFMERFDSENRTFFGISEFNLSMTDVRYLEVQTYNISLIGDLYEKNSALNYMKYHMIFFARRNCDDPNITFYDPQTYDCFLTCDDVASSYGIANAAHYLGVSKICMPCHYSCLDCTQTQCLVCPVDSFRLTTPTGIKCNCQIGYADAAKRICQPCSKYLFGCLECSSTSFCTKCDIAFNYQLKAIDTQNKICTCKADTYNATGFCLDYPGCKNATLFSNIIECKECDATKNFVLNTILSECSCMFGYFPNTTINNTVDNQVCVDVCGDNIVAVGKCDDGNEEYGDGCDQFCNVEAGYDCSSVNFSTNGSVCFRQETIVITYLYSQRYLQSNKFKLVFSFSPAKFALNESSFKNHINISLYEEQPKNTFFTYDPVSSQIIFEIQYFVDVEGTSHNMNISFHNLSFFAEPKTVNFSPVGINAMLVIDHYNSLNNILSIVISICILIAVLIAIFASVVALKMVGIELLIPIQIIYFSLAAIQSHRSHTSVLSNLKYSNGFNSIQTYSYARSYSQHKNLIGMAYQTEFLLNSNVMLGIYFIILLWLLFNHLKLRYKESKLGQFLQKNDLKDKEDGQQSQKAEESSEEEELLKLKKKKPVDEQLEYEQSELRQDHHQALKFFGFYVDRIYFIFYTILMNQVFFSFFLMALNMPISTFYFSKELYAISLNFVFFIFIGNLVFIHTDQESSKMIVFNCINDRYVYYYYLIDFIIVIVMVLSFQEVFVSYLITVLSFSYIILIIVEKPYSSILFSLENVVALYLHIMLFICLIIVCLIDSQPNMSEGKSLLYACLITGFIIIGEILTIIRLVLKVNFKKAFDDLMNHNNPKENQKKENRVIQKNLDLLEEDDRNLEIIPSDEIKNGLFTPKNRMIDWQSKNSSEYHSYRKNEAQHDTNDNPDNKIEEQEGKEDNDELDSQTDRKLTELDILKKKLRNNLKQKQDQQGKSKVN